jgi:hypothetical protein
MIPTRVDDQTRIAAHVADRIRELGRTDVVDFVHINPGPFHPVAPGEEVTVASHGVEWSVMVKIKGDMPRDITVTGRRGADLEDAERRLFVHLDKWLVSGDYCSHF